MSFEIIKISQFFWLSYIDKAVRNLDLAFDGQERTTTAAQKDRVRDRS